MSCISYLSGALVIDAIYLHNTYYVCVYMHVIGGYLRLDPSDPMIKADRIHAFYYYTLYYYSSPFSCFYTFYYYVYTCTGYIGIYFFALYTWANAHSIIFYIPIYFFITRINLYVG